MVDLNARRQLPLFSIGMVQKLTGLTARQIRYYEQHGLVHPVRSEGNQRQFSFADVEQLMQIRSLLDDGMTMVEVKSALERQDAGYTNRKHDTPVELSDQDVYKLVQKELMEGPPTGSSLFQGDLSRFYRRK